MSDVYYGYGIVIALHSRWLAIDGARPTNALYGFLRLACLCVGSDTSLSVYCDWRYRDILNVAVGAGMTSSSFRRVGRVI